MLHRGEGNARQLYLLEDRAHTENNRRRVGSAYRRWRKFEEKKIQDINDPASLSAAQMQM